MAHRPRHSPKMDIIDETHEKSLSSPKSVSIIKRIFKPQISRKGVKIHEIRALVSLPSKKWKAHEMVKKLTKKQKKVQDPRDEVVLETDFKDSGGYRSPLRHEDMGFPLT